MTHSEKIEKIIKYIESKGLPVIQAEMEMICDLMYFAREGAAVMDMHEGDHIAREKLDAFVYIELRGNSISQYYGSSPKAAIDKAKVSE